MIELHNLCMSYRLEQAQLTVLYGAQLNIKAGETLAIVGPSGSGKTTLLTLLAGLEQPESGDIMLNNVKLNALDADSLADIRRDQLGIIFQSFHLVQSLTALGNVALRLKLQAIGTPLRSPVKCLKKLASLSAKTIIVHSSLEESSSGLRLPEH